MKTRAMKQTNKMLTRLSEYIGWDLGNRDKVDISWSPNLLNLWPLVVSRAADWDIGLEKCHDVKKTISKNTTMAGLKDNETILNLNMAIATWKRKKNAVNFRCIRGITNFKQVTSADCFISI
jgi:hypothetical protein